MAFKSKPLGLINPTMGIDWNSIAKKIAEQLGCEYSLSFLYGNPNPSQNLHPLAKARVRFAYEKLGSGGMLPVISFFGTKEDAEAIAATIISNEFGVNPEDDWDWILDDENFPIRVASHRSDRLAFALNAYSVSREQVQIQNGTRTTPSDDELDFDEDES